MELGAGSWLTRARVWLVKRPNATHQRMASMRARRLKFLLRKLIVKVNPSFLHVVFRRKMITHYHYPQVIVQIYNQSWTQ